MRGAVCGRVTVDGGRCQNPPGCTLPHRPPAPAPSGIAPVDLARTPVPGPDPVSRPGPVQDTPDSDAVVRVAEILGSVVAARDEYGDDPDVPDLETDLSDLVAGLARSRRLPDGLQEQADRFVERYDRHAAEFEGWVAAGGRGVDDAERLDRQRKNLTAEGTAIAEAFFYEHVTPGDLSHLAGHPSPDVRRLAGQHPRCPADARAHAGLLAD